MNYICPVCGYDRLEEPPADYNICPSCGTEFGYDDFTVSHEELRERWLANGATWWSDYTSPPRIWSPFRQLLRVTHPLAAIDVRTDGEELTMLSNRYSSVEVQPRVAINPIYSGPTLTFSASIMSRRRAA